MTTASSITSEWIGTTAPPSLYINNLSPKEMEIIRSLDSRSFGFLDFAHPAVDGNEDCESLSSSSGSGGNVAAGFISKDFIRKGISILQNELMLDPLGTRPHILCQIGHLHLLLEDFPHALSAYLNYSRICPDAGNDASYLYGLGLVYFAFGEYNWSALSFQKVLSQCPDFGRLGEVHIRLAIIHKDNGNLMKSIDHFSKAYGVNGTSSMTKLEIQFHIGHLHYLRGDCGGAKLCFEAILASKNIPNHIKALTLRQLGWLYHTVPHIFSFSNPSLKAIELLKLAVGANPQCPLSWYLLGRCHSSLGQSKEAFMSYRQSISKHEKQPDTWCAIGILYHQMGQARDSLQAYITALYFDINHTAGWIDLGLLYESCGHLIDGLLCYKNGLSSINKRHTSSSPSSSSDDITNLLLNRHNYVEQYVNQTGGVAFYSAHPRSTLPSLQESWNTLIPDSLRVKYPSTQTPILCLPSSPIPPSPLLSPLTGRSSNKRYKTQKSKDPIILKNINEGWSESQVVGPPSYNHTPLTPPYVSPAHIPTPTYDDSIESILPPPISNMSPTGPPPVYYYPTTSANNGFTHQGQSNIHYKPNPQSPPISSMASFGYPAYCETHSRSPPSAGMGMGPPDFSSFLSSINAASPINIDNYLHGYANPDSAHSSKGRQLELQSKALPTYKPSRKRSCPGNEPMAANSPKMIAMSPTRQNWLFREHHIITSIPGQSTGSPLVSTGSPLASVGNPLVSTGSPLASIGTSTGSPLTSISNPLAFIGSPLGSVGSPLTSISSPLVSHSYPVQIQLSETHTSANPHSHTSTNPHSHSSNCSGNVSDTSSGVSSSNTPSSPSKIGPSSFLYPPPAPSVTTPTITPIHEPHPGLGKESEYMKDAPLRPPSPSSPSSDNLHPDVPIYTITSYDESNLHLFCTDSFNVPICIIRGLPQAVGFDLSLFTSESLMRDHGDHEVEVREQILQAADKNSDILGKKQIWKCESNRSKTTVMEYGEYQKDILNNEKSFKESEEKKMLKFGTNCDLSNQEKWKDQLIEISKLPHFMRVDCPQSNFLNHVGHTVLGMNSVQLYMKVPGCRTPGHQENNNFCSVNINIGPGDCEWFAVPNEYWGRMHELCEKHKISFLVGSWWPILHELEEYNIPVYRFTQYSGETVWINPGTVHWVQANSCCNNVAWNVGPITAHQLRMAWERYQWNKSLKVRSIVPMMTLTWNFAKNVIIKEPHIFQQINSLLCSSYSQCEQLLHQLDQLNIPVTWHGHIEGEPTPTCTLCLDEVFNILFVSTNKKGDHLVYCHKCIQQLNSKNKKPNFVVLQQYALEDLKKILDKFNPSS